MLRNLCRDIANTRILSEEQRAWLSEALRPTGASSVELRVYNRKQGRVESGQMNFLRSAKLLQAAEYAAALTCTVRKKIADHEAAIKFGFSADQVGEERRRLKKLKWPIPPLSVLSSNPPQHDVEAYDKECSDYEASIGGEKIQTDLIEQEKDRIISFAKDALGRRSSEFADIVIKTLEPALSRLASDFNELEFDPFRKEVYDALIDEVLWAIEKRICRAISRPNITPEAEPQAFHIKEATKYTRLSRATLYRLIKCGQLRSIKVGRRRLLLRADLVALLEAGIQ
jgi:excisionase family DNA binding protein